MTWCTVARGGHACPRALQLLAVSGRRRLHMFPCCLLPPPLPVLMHACACVRVGCMVHCARAPTCAWVQAINHTSPDVRKAAVLAMVEMHAVAGPRVMLRLEAVLKPAQLKLVTLYVERDGRGPLTGAHATRRVQSAVRGVLCVVCFARCAVRGALSAWCAGCGVLGAVCRVR